MSGYKEFQGKTLDEAILDACSFYDTTRERLEVEILNDAKAGIFGLVGSKKATIRARVVHLASVLEGLDAGRDRNGSRRQASEPRPSGRKNDVAARREKPRDMPPPAADEAQAVQPESAPRMQPGRKNEAARRERPRPSGPLSGEVAAAREEAAPGSSGGRQRKERPQADTRQRRARTLANGDGQRPDLRQDQGAEGNGLDLECEADDLRRVPFSQLDAQELSSAAREIVARLTESYVGSSTIEVEIASDRVRVTISGVEDPGLLIGRDGQTLASLQYLVTRMLSTRMKALLRVQIDAGDYRERQDERLRDLALSLADKAKSSGRPQVTRPLSSYHRRVIHLALQDDPAIQTHSKGEGEMKRVMVTRRKGQ